MSFACVEREKAAFFCFFYRGQGGKRNTPIFNISLLILLLGNISIIDIISIGLLDGVNLIIRIYLENR